MGPAYSRTLVTQQSLAQVPVKRFSSTPLSSPDSLCSFYSCLGGTGILVELGPPQVHSPGIVTMQSSLEAGPPPRAGSGGKVGLLPGNHRPQPYSLSGPLLPCWQLLKWPRPSPPTDTWHHASVCLGFHKRKGETQTSGKKHDVCWK